MLTLQGITYVHPDAHVQFKNISLTIHAGEKAALAGNNGSGKSTLLKLMAGRLKPREGSITGPSAYYVPQVSGLQEHLSIAGALQVQDQIQALQDILHGHVSEYNLQLLNEDWEIEARCREAMQAWDLGDLPLNTRMAELSGGQKTKIFLAGIYIHKPRLILLDEPGNHLDSNGRALLYDLIQRSGSTIIVVSHDRTLLNLLDPVYELSKGCISRYGGNYSFYETQKQLEKQVQDQDLKSREKALRKARETERETAERRQRLDTRGKKKQEKAGLPRISMNTLRNKAEKSTSRLKQVHSEKTGVLLQELQEARSAVPGIEKMKLGFEASSLQQGKTLIRVKDLNYSYSGRPLWKRGLNFELYAGERLALQGANGCGKTTLVKLLLHQLVPVSGHIHSTVANTVYLDQDYSPVDSPNSVYGLAQQFNSGALQEHEIKTRLNRFLFPADSWTKACHALSGGERMRLMLCCLTLGKQAPDMIILDEPTNNLDILNMDILVNALSDYPGTLLVISHDSSFLEQIRIDRSIHIA